jgi:hypothetical protein
MDRSTQENLKRRFDEKWIVIILIMQESEVYIK